MWRCGPARAEVPAGTLDRLGPDVFTRAHAGTARCGRQATLGQSGRPADPGAPGRSGGPGAAPGSTAGLRSHRPPHRQPAARTGAGRPHHAPGVRQHDRRVRRLRRRGGGRDAGGEPWHRPRPPSGRCRGATAALRASQRVPRDDSAHTGYLRAGSRGGRPPRSCTPGDAGPADCRRRLHQPHPCRRSGARLPAGPDGGSASARGERLR